MSKLSNMTIRPRVIVDCARMTEHLNTEHLLRKNWFNDDLERIHPSINTQWHYSGGRLAVYPNDSLTEDGIILLRTMCELYLKL